MKIGICADLHLRGDRPLCRTDEDWMETQRQDLRKMFSAFDGCDEVWVAGDVFHTPRVSTECVNMALREFIDARIYYDYTIRILAGNHDLPEHNYDNMERCSLGVLLKMFPELNSDVYDLDYSDERVPFVSAHPFGHDDLEEADKCSIWVTHQLTFPDDSARPFPDLGRTARELLDSVPHCRCIVTGDYHHGYLFEDVEGRKVITPGCLNVQVADMEDYDPRVYVLDTATGAVEERMLHTNRKGTVCTEYLVEERERDSRIERAMQAADGIAAVGLDFRGNLEKIAAMASEPARKTINSIMDTINGDRK